MAYRGVAPELAPPSYEGLEAQDSDTSLNSDALEDTLKAGKTSKSGNGKVAAQLDADTDSAEDDEDNSSEEGKDEEDSEKDEAEDDSSEANSGSEEGSAAEGDQTTRVAEIEEEDCSDVVDLEEGASGGEEENSDDDSSTASSAVEADWEAASIDKEAEVEVATRSNCMYVAHNKPT